VTTEIINGTVKLTGSDARSLGITSGRYQPSLDGERRMFKGGYYYSINYNIYIKGTSRNTLVYVTNMQGVNVTVPTSIVAENTRILQSAATPLASNSMEIYFGSSDFTGAASIQITFISILFFSALALVTIF
jgi:hypothetical protein